MSSVDQHSGRLSTRLPCFGALRRLVVFRLSIRRRVRHLVDAPAHGPSAAAVSGYGANCCAKPVLACLRDYADTLAVKHDVVAPAPVQPAVDALTDPDGCASQGVVFFHICLSSSVAPCNGRVIAERRMRDVCLLGSYRNA